MISAADIFFTCTIGVSGGAGPGRSVMQKQSSGMIAIKREVLYLVIHGGKERLGVIVLIALTEAKQVSATLTTE